MTMPEASIDENNGFVSFEDDIRFSRQLCVKKPISESVYMQKMPDHQLGFGVFWSYHTHGIASDLFAVSIHISLLRISSKNPTKKACF